MPTAYDDRCHLIGDRLRAARRELKLTRAGLSALTDPPLTNTRIRNYEQGRRRPGLEEAHNLSAAMGNITATYLLGFDTYSTFTEQELLLIEQFRCTDDRGRAALLALAREEAEQVWMRPMLDLWIKLSG
jgi:transcriptional regulator with XRE-family HTH domain